MDTTTQLFIRACKSKNSKQRVQSVYNRLYGKFDDQSDSYRYIAGLLLSICEEYKLLTLSKLASELDTNHILKRIYPKDVPETSYHQDVIAICISAIRCSKKEKLKGLIPPRKFR